MNEMSLAVLCRSPAGSPAVHVVRVPLAAATAPADEQQKPLAPQGQLDASRISATHLVIPPTFHRYLTGALTSLLLQHNALTAVPDALWSLAGLRELNLSANRLTILSPLVARLTVLEELHLSDNLLTQLPPTLAQCTCLAVLDISNNQLAALPVALTQCRTLRRVWLDGNPLHAGLGPLTMPIAMSLPGITTSLVTTGSQLPAPPSLRALAVQAVGKRMYERGIHCFCQHGHRVDAMLAAQLTQQQLSLAGASRRVLEYWALRETGASPPPDSVAWCAAASMSSLASTLGQFSFDDDEYDHAAAADPYVHQDNFGFIASTVARESTSGSSELSDVDSAMVQAVTAKVVQSYAAYADRLVRREQAAEASIARIQAPLESPISDSSAMSPPPLSLQILRRPSDVTSPSGQGMISPSIPSPPSAYVRFCALQIVPSQLLAAAAAPVAVCDGCGAGVHRLPSSPIMTAEETTPDSTALPVRHVTLRMYLGNLVPVVWALCGAACLARIRQEQLATGAGVKGRTSAGMRYGGGVGPSRSRSREMGWE